MKRFSWYIAAGLVLIALSAAGFAVQIALFHRSSDTAFYILQDFAFLPIEVLFVSLVIDSLLHIREKNELQQKMSMVVGIFFVEAGNDLLRYFSEFDVHLDEMREITCVKSDWSGREFASVEKRLQRHPYSIDCRCADLNDLKRMLADKREFFLGLLANPSLLESESFTELLWALSHLSQELELRPNLYELPDSDYNHLASDMRRAYVQMVTQWLLYVRHLRKTHPYILSLMVRMNPFAEHPSAIVRNHGEVEEEGGVG